MRLVAITHIATNNGMVQPVAEVGWLTRRYGVPFLLDACQSAGQMHLDVEAVGCDMLSATGRKALRAPRGTGFLYVKQRLLETLEPPFLDMRAADWSATDAYTMRPECEAVRGMGVVRGAGARFGSCGEVRAGDWNGPDRSAGADAGCAAAREALRELKALR